MIDSSEFLREHGEKFLKASTSKPTPSSSAAAYRFALRSLSAAGASEKRMEERMERKGFSKLEAREAIAELKRLGFINDASLAEGIVEKCASVMEGEALIRLRLQKAGIGEEEAAKALSSAAPLLEEGREKFLSSLKKECAGDVKKAARMCKKKGQPLGLALKIGASYTPGSVAP